MSRNKMSGFTLIELMVVIVIIGVLASLAIPRFTEASLKAKVAEAPRVIASFESAYLAAVAEGVDVASEDDLVFKRPTSNWYIYSLDGTPVTGLTGTPTAKLKGLPAGASTITTAYNATTGEFDRTAAGYDKLIPNFKTTTTP